MWLVVAPALSNYIQHKWDNNVSNDDQWPYYFKLSGTDIGQSAIIYNPIIIDGREVSNIDFEYNVSFPARNSYEGTAFYVSGKALAAFGTAFQMAEPANDLYSSITEWSSSSPEEGKSKFYACNPKNGYIINAGSTANGYGHWFNNTGTRCNYTDANSTLYSEFLPNLMAFSIGQYPNRVKVGDTYRIAQAIRYKKNDVIAKATFYFNINITADTESYELASINYTDPTGIGAVNADSNSQTSDDVWYTIDGRKLTDKPTQPGIYIHNKEKVMVR